MHNNYGISAEVVLDSYYDTGSKISRVTTMKLRYPRFIHSEFMTHRVFSRNASSSRAIPIQKVISQVWNDPAVPVYWGWNQKGMQSRTPLPANRRKWSVRIWGAAGKAACVFAWCLMRLGNHKQVANRVLEPWQFITVVVTSTQWENFFDLRCHEDADPTIQMLANCMFQAYSESKPKKLSQSEWHLPFVSEDEKSDPRFSNTDLLKFSTARAARTSYVNHDGTVPDWKKDIALYENLVQAKPIHASPAEHQAAPDGIRTDGKWTNPHLHGNLEGWIQHRKLIERNFYKG
jgi:hypothetical protein